MRTLSEEEKHEVKTGIALVMSLAKLQILDNPNEVEVVHKAIFDVLSENKIAPAVGVIHLTRILFGALGICGAGFIKAQLNDGKDPDPTKAFQTMQCIWEYAQSLIDDYIQREFELGEGSPVISLGGSWANAGDSNILEDIKKMVDEANEKGKSSN